MFLAKRGGVYYLFFRDESGKRRTRSTGTRIKPEAVQFLRTFNAEDDARPRAAKRITLEDFSAALLTYSRSVNTLKTVESNRTALNELSRFLGTGRAMHSITPAECERFLATKTSEASAWTAQKYYLALGAAFERAKTLGHITANPWRTVRKPKTPEVIPAYFTREQFMALLAVIQNRDLRELVTPTRELTFVLCFGILQSSGTFFVRSIPPGTGDERDDIRDLPPASLPLPASYIVHHFAICLPVLEESARAIRFFVGARRRSALVPRVRNGSGLCRF